MFDEQKDVSEDAKELNKKYLANIAKYPPWYKTSYTPWKSPEPRARKNLHVEFSADDLSSTHSQNF